MKFSNHFNYAVMSRKHKRLKQRQNRPKTIRPVPITYSVSTVSLKSILIEVLKSCFESVLFTVSETIMNTMTYLAHIPFYIFSDINRFAKLSKVKLVNQK